MVREQLCFARDVIGYGDIRQTRLKLSDCMNITHETVIEADAQHVINFMLDPTFRQKLCLALDGITSIEEVSIETLGQQVQRVLRYKAQTRDKIPSFLSKYKDRAPEFVYWKERAHWDRAKGTMSYIIEPEIQEKWHSYYNVEGKLTFESRAKFTLLKAQLNYDVNVFGLKRLIERAIYSEAEQLLMLQAQIIKAHFAAS